MFGASLVAHTVLFAAVLLVPASWMGAQRAAPETVMTVSLAGPQGPQNGGRRARGRPAGAGHAAAGGQAGAAAATGRGDAGNGRAGQGSATQGPAQGSPAQEGRGPARGDGADSARERRAGATRRYRGQYARRRLRRPDAPAAAVPAGMRSDVGDFCCPQYLAMMESSDPERLGQPPAVAGRHDGSLRDSARRDDDQRGSGAVERQCYARPDRHAGRPSGAAVAAAAGGIHQPVADRPPHVRISAMTLMPRFIRLPR